MNTNKKNFTIIFKKWYFWVFFAIFSLFNTPWWSIEFTPFVILGSLVANFVIVFIIGLIVYAAIKFFK